jgi:hypothetical protein
MTYSTDETGTFEGIPDFSRPCDALRQWLLDQRMDPGVGQRECCIGMVNRWDGHDGSGDVSFHQGLYRVNERGPVANCIMLVPNRIKGGNELHLADIRQQSGVVTTHVAYTD